MGAMCRDRWTDPHAGRALAWLILDDSKGGSPARPALPPGVYAAISSFLRFEHPVEEQIYVVGGRKRHLEDSSGYLDEVEMFDWFRHEWRNVPPISTKRVGAAAVCVDGCLYVAGGYCSRISQPVASVERYCAETEAWSTVAPMLGARYGHAMAAVDGRIYVMGGDAGGTDRMLATCEVYDPRTNAWSEIAKLPTKLAGGRVEVDRGRILYVGGCAELSLSDVVWSYDTDRDVWEPYTRMSVGRSAFALGRVEVEGDPALVVAGGFLDEQDLGAGAENDGLDYSHSAELVCLTRPRAPSEDDSSDDSSATSPLSMHRVPALPEQRSGCRAVTVKRDKVWSAASAKGERGLSNDVLVLLGGEEMRADKESGEDVRAPAMFSTSWIFDARAWQWVEGEVLPPMRTGRTALGVCVAPGYPRSYGFYDCEAA